MKKINKLNDIAFHLVNKINKKKLKLSTLLIKNWDKIFEKDANLVSIKKITLNSKSDSLNIELNLDPSISFKMHTKTNQLMIQMEEILGLKVNKIIFFQDNFSNENYIAKSSRDNNNSSVKTINNENFNDIKDLEVKSIFENIISKINEKN
jgi:hypothetical protein